MTVTELWSALAMSAGIEAGRTNVIKDYEESAAASARKTLDAAEKAAKRASVTCKTEHVPDRHAAEGIVDTARKRKCDLIVMGSHERGMSHTFLGSVAKSVLRRSHVPTLIVPLIATD